MLFGIRAPLAACTPGGGRDPCFADLGDEVTTIDVDEVVIDAINAGRAPITEPGLDERLADHGGDRFTASTDYAAGLGTEVTVIALSTPATVDGSIDISALEESLGRSSSAASRR